MCFFFFFLSVSLLVPCICTYRLVTQWFSPDCFWPHYTNGGAPSQFLILALQAHLQNTFQSNLILLQSNPHFPVATHEMMSFLVHGQFLSDFGRPIQISVRFRQLGSIQDSLWCIVLTIAWKKAILKKQEWLFLCKTPLEHNLRSQWPMN